MIHFLEELGTPISKLTITAKLENSPNPLADLYTGAIDRLPLERIKAIKQIYGIEIPDPNLDREGSAELSVRIEPFDTCQITSIDTESDNPLAIDGEIFVPPAQLLLDDYKPVRVRTPFFSFQLNLSTSGQAVDITLKQHLFDNEPVPIQALANGLPMLYAISSAERQYKITIHSPRLKSLPLLIHVKKPDYTLKEASYAAKALYRFCESQSITESMFATSEQVIESARAISFLWAASQQPTPKENWITVDLPEELDIDQQFAIVIWTRVQLGGHMLVALTINEGLPLADELKRVSITNTFIHAVLVFDAESVDKDAIKASIENALAPYESTHETTNRYVDFKN